MNAIDQLLWVADAASGLRPIPPEVVGAFRLAIADVATGKASADEALGLKSATRSISTLTAHEARDREIVMAMADFGVDAAALSAALDRYRASGWLRERHLEQCPAHLGGRLEGRLWRILRARDCSLSDRRIRGIAAARR